MQGASPKILSEARLVAAGRKIFLNMCGHDRIPAPGNWKDGKVPEEVTQALDNLGDEAAVEPLRFPLSVGEPVYDLDKSGTPCTVYDIVFNLDIMKQSQTMSQLKVFLIEMGMGRVQQKYGSALSEKFKLPKIKYKGGDTPRSTYVRNEA